ncbi:MAG: hypothetical protein WCF84_00025 [Anaerolineae bacterium]
MSRWSWIPSALEFEDALLFVWLVLVTPLLQFVFGDALRGLNLGNLNRDLPNGLWLGILFLVSTLLAIVCTLTRAPDERQAAVMITGAPFGYAHLPMLTATGITLFLGLDLLGLGDAAIGLMCLLFGLFVGVGVIYNRMPVIDYSLRRILMTPFSILTTTLFVSSINPIFANVDANGVLQIVQTDSGRFVFGLLLAGVLFYYLMFVFAPRQIAGSGGGWLQWGARFVLYLVGLILNIRLLQLV